MRFTVSPLVVTAIIFKVALAGPISKRWSGLSCGKVFDNTNGLGYSNSHGNPNALLGKKFSEKGQWQVTQLEDGAETLNVDIRHCHSSYLKTTSDTSRTFVKIFLAEDNNKCLQRHDSLPSSNPNATTHITIEDCSNVDDATQIRQFWSFFTENGTNNQTISPIVKTNGEFVVLDLILSKTSPPALLASRTNPDPDAGLSAITY
ncbi:uncharacterized protein FA14DRAFT_179499 [Meira miltonrushii]|uniref:Uncharacterized protein n=1 Tax=Meira miltonrushii TaxID=1280837 RepID=A0A316VET5_9BASI|nr:uncharacterized protein FA14DRAFT_179499 [Meira miltonrushii]PWN36137.1 hypothetical protein FA14DRAFT_179499 [Meira miltonrushii]